MPVEVALGTQLADALHAEILPKLAEVGWGSGEASDTAMTEYIILMLVNGKTQEEIAQELANELLGLSPDDPGAAAFSGWLFEQVEAQNAKINGGATENMAISQDESTTVDGDQDMDMSGPSVEGVEFFAPTGPKAMRDLRHAENRRGGREKRMVGQINRALDRNPDSVLHRVRGQSGNERINTHTRTPPSGPRMGVGRQPRNANGRAASIAHGMAGGMPGMPPGPGGMNGMNPAWMMPGQPGPQMDVYAMLEQQSRMMQQMQQQMNQQMIMQNQQHGQNGRFNQHGRPLSDRIQHPHKNFRKGPHHQNGNAPPHSDQAKNGAAAGGEDVDMAGPKREATNPDETVCKFNLNCNNKDCKFAHQSPAAPPGAAIDVQDVCSFGAACKNKKCVGRHPSPANRTAHQNEQDCKFFPNCTNPRCPFRHPSMPLCRNGGDCSVPGCKFTHVKTMCKFRPCTNRYCTYKHDDGQRGAFQDKVWTADGGKDHISDRKFADENAVEDNVLQDQDKEMATEEPTIE